MIALLCILVGTLYEGFVVTTLWAWFAVPLGAPVINIPTAIGLILIVGLAAPKAVFSEMHAARNSPPGETFKIFLLYGLIVPTAALASGWIACALNH